MVGKKLCSAVVFATCLGFACATRQQDQPDPPVKLESVDAEYKGDVEKLLRATLALPPDAEQKPQFVRPGLVLPRVVKAAPAAPPELLAFYSVPSPSDAEFKSGNRTYADKLGEAADRVQIGKFKPSPAQAKAITEAKKLLFEDGDEQKPSADYSKYQKYEKEYNEAMAGLRKATSASERANHQQKLMTTERDWKLFGKKAEISQAVATLAAVDVGGTKDLLAAWKKTISENKPDAAEVWAALADQNGWVSLSFSPPTRRGAALTATTRKKEGADGFVLIPGLKLVTLKICRVTLRHPALDHPFLRNRHWRFDEKGGRLVLSGGDPKQTQADELVPWKVSQVVLAKGVEFQFADQNGWQALVDAVEANDEVSFGGFVIKGGGNQPNYTSPRYLALSNPCVIAALIERLPKIPDPDPQLEW